MNIINKFKLNVLYPELKGLDFDNKTLEKILKNKNIRQQYKDDIKPFIEHLNNRGYNIFDHSTNALNTDVMNQHLKAVFELSINNNANKYISFILQNKYENNKIDNYYAFDASNYEEIFSMLHFDILKENISEIVKNGYSERLVELLNNNKNVYINNISSNVFCDKVWNVICQNPSIGNEKVINIFNQQMNTLAYLINNDYFEGMKYTYENILESQSFINTRLFHGGYYIENISFQQFSMDFIKNVGDDVLKKMYSSSLFYNEKEYKKVFEISSVGNYELITDIINYDPYFSDFENFSEDDIHKPLIETSSNAYDKRKFLLNKYFGVNKNDADNFKLVIDAINRVNNFPDDFSEKYSEVLQIINKIFSSNDTEIINLSKTIDSSKKDEYKELIKSIENDGNEVIKKQFVSDLKSKNQDIINNAQHQSIVKDNNSIDVYELSGQPFTMLVHAISNNNLSVNNSYVNEIINDPANWNNIGGGNNFISTSLISDKYMRTYAIPNNNGTVMFGFNDISYDCLKYTDTKDVGINRSADANANVNMRARIFEAKTNTVVTLDYLMEKTIEFNPNNEIWNEVGLLRKDKTSGMKLQPNYIVCMDKISDNSIKAAEYFKVPIYLINRKCYSDQLNIVKNNDLKDSYSSLEETRLKK